jgi:hypothetical protein
MSEKEYAVAELYSKFLCIRMMSVAEYDIYVVVPEGHHLTRMALACNKFAIECTVSACCTYNFTFESN